MQLGQIKQIVKKKKERNKERQKHIQLLQLQPGVREKPANIDKQEE